MRTFLLGLGALMTNFVLGAQVPRRQVDVVTSPTSEQYRGALRFGSEGNFVRARQELNAVLRADPTHTSARLRLRVLDDVEARVIPAATAVHLFRATALTENGRREDVIAEIDAGIKLSPRYHEAYRLRGRARTDLGDYHGAVEDYTRAIALDSTNTIAYLNRAAAFIRTGDIERSLSDFTEAIRREPLNAEAYSTRGVAFSMHNAQARAMADFEKAIQLDPGLAPAYLNKAKLEEDAGRVADAVRTLKALVQHARPGYSRQIEYARSRLKELGGT